MHHYKCIELCEANSFQEDHLLLQPHVKNVKLSMELYHPGDVSESERSSVIAAQAPVLWQGLK